MLKVDLKNAFSINEIKTITLILYESKLLNPLLINVQNKAQIIERLTQFRF